VKITVDQKTLYGASCEALELLAQSLQAMGHFQGVAIIRSIAKAKGCPVTQAPGVYTLQL
jgi:NAD(P)H-nitrite reductase large subunit